MYAYALVLCCLLQDRMVGLCHVIRISFNYRYLRVVRERQKIQLMNLSINCKCGYWYIHFLFLQLIVHRLIANDSKQHPTSHIFTLKREEEEL